MNKLFLQISVLSLILLFATACGKKQKLQSPNDKLEINLDYSKINQPNQFAFQVYFINNNKAVEALSVNKIGVSFADSTGIDLTYTGEMTTRPIIEDYDMLVGKKSHCHNEANEYTLAFTDKQSNNVNLVIRLYNDGIAFRYEFDNLNDTKLSDEFTTYQIAEGKNRWIQEFEPSYERFFPLATTGNGKIHHLGYPALIQQSENCFALISESGIEKFNCASQLKNDSISTDYKVCLDENNKLFKGKFTTPWRVAIIGSLADIVESTLITDVAPASTISDTEWIKPGVVSWIYWAYNHGSNDYKIICQYIDMAAELKLPYMLIDAEWDGMANGGDINDAIAYAKQKNVKLLVWYNSSVTNWVQWGPTPKFRLNKPEDREKEYSWLEENGISGAKIDFFTGDTQETMEYCIDLLEDAAKHHLLINFHGATIPRGWQRTYPNLMSMEAVLGAEWYNNGPLLTNSAAIHNTTIPFTRNVIGSMDYTPCTFSDSQNPHITSNAHELALTVVFESGLQHLADKPESYLTQPQEVKDFFGQLPSTWDETKLLSGYPGESIVIARRKADTWFIGGLNGTSDKKTISVDWSFLGEKITSSQIYEDSGEAENPWKISSSNELPQSFECQPRGGFIVVVNK